jgi:hypothetical protein
MSPPAPALRPLCALRIELGPPLELGPTPRGRRRIIPITGGAVTGARLAGRVLPGGADWQTVFADGSAELDARYAIETADGALLDMRNFGYRHGPPEVLAALANGAPVAPERYYMRTQPRIETGDPRYAWLNSTILLGSGARLPDAVLLELFEVL